MIMDIPELPLTDPLGDELERLFPDRTRQKSKLVEARQFTGPSLSICRPRLTSDGPEDFTALAWQCQSPNSEVTFAPAELTTKESDSFNQLIKLVGEIGLAKAISYLQYLVRLNGRTEPAAVRPSLPCTLVTPTSLSAPCSPYTSSPYAGQFSYTSGAPASAPVTPVTDSPRPEFFLTAPPPPPPPPGVTPATAPPGFVVGGPSSAPATPTNTSDATKPRLSRWESAGLPRLGSPSRSPPHNRSDSSSAPGTPVDGFPGAASQAGSSPLSLSGSTWPPSPASSGGPSRSAPTTPTTATGNPWQDASGTQLNESDAATQELLMEILKRNNSGSKARSGRQDIVCVFCRNNGEARKVYTSHRLKDVNGIIQCPVLRMYVCPTCGASGDVAHTLKYCPKSKYSAAARMPLCSNRKSNGKVRANLQK